MTNPSRTVAEALEHPDIAHFKQEFQETLVQTLLCVMEGIRARKSTPPACRD